ncbi:MAG: ribonuclease III [Bacteroidia bacterium]|nr:ribonuclease III [Bacteroidia bacterium]
MIKILSALKPLPKNDKAFRQKLKNILGFYPSNLALYYQAFRHSSTNVSEFKQSNERLEFLGDAVLGMVVAEYLFKLYPKENEGFLTQIRSRIVNGQNLQMLSKKFGFDTLLTSKLTQKDRINSSAYGDAFEAFIGALYLDKGFDVTKNFILNKIIKLHLDMNTVLQNNTDYKSQLQILMQKQKNTFEYKLLNEYKTEKGKLYHVQLIIENVPIVEFEHSSKKVAEQKVAQLALEILSKD